MRLLVVTLCCFVTPPIVRADPTEDAAIKAVKQLRGRVEENGKVVDLLRTEVTDAELKELAALKNLTTLDLSRTRVTDAGMKELATLKNLTNLDLSETTVTNAGMKELADLRNLRILSLLSCTNLTDDGVKQLATLKKLTYLDLIMTRISDTGLMELSAIPGLAHLRVFGPNLSEAGEKTFKQRNPKCELSGPTWRHAINR